MYTGLRPTSLLFVIRENIVLKQTPLYHHWLKIMSEKGQIFKLYTNNPSAIRKSKDGKSNTLMLAGGPKIIEGKLLPNNDNFKVLQIFYVQGNYYIALQEIKHEQDNKTTNT